MSEPNKDLGPTQDSLDHSLQQIKLVEVPSLLPSLFVQAMERFPQDSIQIMEETRKVIPLRVNKDTIVEVFGEIDKNKQALEKEMKRATNQERVDSLIRMVGYFRTFEEIVDQHTRGFSGMSGRELAKIVDVPKIV